MRIAFLVAVAALCLGCGNGFPPYSHLHTLSVLAITADPPEVAAGASATVRVFAFDPAQRPIAVAWALCTLTALPGSGADVDPRCVAAAPAPFLIALGSGEQQTVTMPEVRPTDLGLPDASSGFYVPVRAVVTAGDSTVTAIYRLRLAVAGPPNHNPIVTSIDRKGGDPIVDGAVIHAGDALTLSAVFAPGSAEDYFVLDFTTRMPVPAHEALRVSWFATDGVFSQERTGIDRPETVWTLDRAQPPGPVELFAVGRDERGGTAIVHRSLVVR